MLPIMGIRTETDCTSNLPAHSAGEPAVFVWACGGNLRRIVQLVSSFIDEDNLRSGGGREGSSAVEDPREVVDSVRSATL
jgi:hypothetical protein